MKTKFSNALIDLLMKRNSSLVVYKNIWGARPPISMGDGIKFQVTKSPIVDYVYIRYLGGYNVYEVEFGALVGTEYDVIDRIKPVNADKLMQTITKRLFAFDVIQEPVPPPENQDRNEMESLASDLGVEIGSDGELDLAS